MGVLPMVRLAFEVNLFTQHDGSATIPSFLEVTPPRILLSVHLRKRAPGHYDKERLK
jgi:hypothetical protein